MVGAALQSTAVAIVSDRVGGGGRSGVAGSSGGFGRGSNAEIGFLQRWWQQGG